MEPTMNSLDYGKITTFKHFPKCPLYCCRWLDGCTLNLNQFQDLCSNNFGDE